MFYTKPLFYELHNHECEVKMDGPTPSSGRGDIIRPKLIEIGIPAYNEESTIGDVLLGALSVIKKLKKFEKGLDIKLVVVNDGSTDATGDIAKSLGAVVLSHKRNRGAGASIRTLLIYALRTGADIVVLMDADGQHPPEEIPKLLGPVLRGEADVVIGSRFLRGHSYRVPSLKKIGIIFYSILTSMLIRRRITDVTSGFRAMNKRAVELVAPIYPDDHYAVKITIYMGLRGLKIVEVPVSMRPRRSGSSFIRGRALLSYHLKVLRYVIHALAGR